MKLSAALTLLLAFPLHAEDNPQPAIQKPQWKRALPGFTYEFPRDHFSHPDFKTEWWYATGNLESESGQKFGYQFTIFRQGIRPPGSAPKTTSRFVRNHFYFAHVAISDIGSEKFYFSQITSRGAFDEAGSPPWHQSETPGPNRGTGIPARRPHDPAQPQLPPSGSRLAFLPNNTQIRLLKDGSFQIASDTKTQDGTPFSLDLTLTPAAPKPIIQGKDGVSQKSAGEGHASHYYSYPNLTAKGTLKLGNDTPPIQVTGKSWLDREWFTSMLAKDQVGWDWFSIHLDDGRQLMLYQLRLKDGNPDPASSGTLISKDRTKRHLARSDFTLEPLETWTSPHTGASYPSKWRIRIPSQDIDITAATMLDDQELALEVVQSYEGAISVSGSHPGMGYMELTGYAGPLTALTP